MNKQSLGWILAGTVLSLSSQAQKIEVTYSDRIAGILQQNCTGCHSNQGFGGFSLENYSDVRANMNSIIEQVRANKMPHGATARSECSPPGTFIGPSRLTHAQINELEFWAKSGAPAGDLNAIQLPESGETPNLNRPPDLILDNDPSGYQIPAGTEEGPTVRNIVRNFPIAVPFKEDHYVVGVKIIPDGGNLDPKTGLNRLIHHAHLFYDEKAKSPGLMEAYRAKHPNDREPGFIGDEGLPKFVLGPWFPGQDGVTLYPAGVGSLIKAGSYFVMQVHYALYNKQAYQDHTKVAVWLAHEPIHKVRQSVIIKNETFKVPAGDDHFVVEASKTFDKGITIYSMLPHMHQLGRDFLVSAVKPGSAAPQCMVDVEWDFNHQNQFVYQKPLELPPGSTIRTRAVYDNSELNPEQFNHPAKEVIWGEASDQEMMLTILAFSYNDQYLEPQSPVVASVSKKRGVLQVEGQGIQPGAFIEINDRFAMDTTMLGNSLSSGSRWKELRAPRSHAMKIQVVNPDGGRSNVVTIR